MAPISRAKVSLRISGDDLDPEEITRRLRCAPTAANRRGDVRPSRSAGGVTARAGSWCLAAEDGSQGDVDGEIRRLLSLVSEDAEVWKDLTRRYRCDVFCGLFMSGGAEGLSLGSETLALLGARGLRLDLDIYGPVDP